jgi:hypothetical protein
LSITLRIDPPLPCGAWKPAPGDLERRCGQPASVAQADPMPGGSYLILPLCRDCVAATARNYGLTDTKGAEG